MLEERPLFSTTESDGTQGGHQFAVVNFSHAVLLSNDRPVVANGTELIYFDTTGRAVAIGGRRGAGPGEFTGIRDLFQVGDGVGAFDLRQRRISLYSPLGSHVRDLSIEAAAGLRVLGWLRDLGPVTSSRPEGKATTYSVRDSAGGELNTFVGPPDPPSLTASWVQSDGRRQTLTGLLECIPRQLATVLGDIVYVVDQRAGSILAYSRNGSKRVIHETPRHRTVTDTMLELLRSVYSEAGAPADTTSVVLRRFGNEGDRLPFVWDQLLPDATGRLWLRVGECGVGSKTWEWDVVDTSGKSLGVLASQYLLRAVRGDRAVALSSDSSERLFVNLYRVQQPPIP